MVDDVIVIDQRLKNLLDAIAARGVLGNDAHAVANVILREWVWANMFELSEQQDIEVNAILTGAQVD